METLLIPSRFRGPDRSGNGGWTAGALAAALTSEGTTPHPPVEVTLRTPPPLDRALDVRVATDHATLADGEAAVATARLVPQEEAPAPVAGVPLAEARRAAQAFAGHGEHPFPHCFVCGTARAEGDGLRLFPGAVEPVDGIARVATTWTPDPSLADEDDPTRVAPAVVWAALDCPGAWTVDLAGRAIVLGRMTAAIDALPLLGEEHVVTGGLLGNEGRKWFTASSVHDLDGRVVARARHTWIEIDPATFNA